MKIGCLTGKFAPLHKGHLHFVNEACKQVDKLYVVLSYDDKFFDGLDNPDYWREKLSKRNRIIWLKENLDSEKIEVVCIDESNIRSYPDGVDDWGQLVRQAVSQKIDKWFSSEPEYEWWINRCFPEAEHIVIDAERSECNISATKVRSDVFRYSNMLPDSVAKHFQLKVAVIGTESCGKTTLSKDLQWTYNNTSFVAEYGRTFCEQDLCMDESLLEFSDYGYIAMKRYVEESEAEGMLLIADTNAFVTQFYCRLYEGRNHPLVDEVIKMEEYDIILHLDDDVPWVDDGLRENGTPEQRKKTKELFNKMLDEYNLMCDNYHVISGSYEERFEKALKIIDSKLRG